MVYGSGAQPGDHRLYAVSKKTTDAEAKYHSSRLELFDVIWSLIR